MKLNISNKAVYRIVLLLLLLYIALGVYGLYKNEIHDIDSVKNFMTPSVKIESAVISVIVTSIVYYFFKDVELKPKIEQLQSKTFLRVALVFIFFGIVVILIACNQGFLFIINSKYGEQESVIVEGKVVYKHVDIASDRSHHRTYFVDIRNSLENKLYHLQVNKGMYNSCNYFGQFNYEFKKGYFGIIYKND